MIVTVRLTKSVVTEYYTRELNGTFRLYDSVSSDFYVGELAEADTDKEIDGYTFNGEYSGNVLDGLVEENGDLVLKCYYEQNGVEGRSPAMLTLADGCAPYVTFGSMPMTGEYEKDAIDGTYFLNATGFTPVNGVQAGSWFTRFNFTLNEQDIGKYLAVNIYYTQLDGVGVDKYKGKMRLWKNVVSDIMPLEEVYRYNSDYTLSDSVETGRWYTLITPLTSDYFKAGSIDISFSEYVDTKAFIADILIVEPEVAQKYYGFSTYTVQHCLQQIDGSYSIADAEEVAGTAGTTYTAAAKTYQGYTFKAEQSVVSGTMPWVGKLVLTLKYDIAEGTDTVALGAGAISPDAAGLAQTITYTVQEMTDIENAMANTYFYSQGTNSGGGSGWSDQMTITLSEDYIGKYLAIKIYYVKETSSVIFWTNKTVGGTEIATVYDEEGNEVTDVSEMTTGKWYTHLLYLNENDYQAGRLGCALGDFKPGMQAYVAAVSLISESTAEQYYGI